MHYLKKELYERIKSDDKIFDFLQQSALDGLWYWDLTNPDQEWMNAEFWATLGYDPATKPHLASAWMNIIHPDDLAAAKLLVDTHCADPSVPYDQVVRYQHAHGHTVWIRCRGLAIRDDNGVPVRMLGAHVDVTAEKEKELLLRKSQEIAHIGTWEVNLAKNTLYWNRITKRIHEVAPDFEPDLATAVKFYKAGDSRRLINEQLERAVATGESFDTELQIVTATGREVWVRAIGEPEMIDGECQRIIGVFQDIDDRKKTEDRMLNYSILEAKATEMEQFSYAASHDLREPLLTIKGYVEVICEDFSDQLSAEVMDHLRTITGATQRMDDLIKGLLDYSRLSQAKQWQSIDMNELVRQVLTDLGSATKLIEVNVQLGSLPIVYGYPLELKILVQNLLSNAIKYRRREIPLELTISCEESDDFFEIIVADNGIGIADNQRENIFQLFRQLHLQGEYAGSGIGLANCKKIAELHGGAIWVESVPGEGSTFHFTVRKELRE